MSDYERTQHTPIDSYACQRCGRCDGLDAVAPNDVWLQIADRMEAILCLWCMDEIATEKGIECSVSLHFAGRALYGTSNSDADQDHISRVVQQRDELERELAIEREPKSPRLLRCEYGGWLAISKPGAFVNIGVVGSTAKEAKERFTVALEEWRHSLEQPPCWAQYPRHLREATS